MSGLLQLPVAVELSFVIDNVLQFLLLNEVERKKRSTPPVITNRISNDF